MIRTIKLKLSTTPQDRHILLQTLSIGSNIYNIQSSYAFKHNTHSKNILHKDCYRNIRNKYPEFPSALVQTVRDNVVESLKSIKSNAKHDKNHVLTKAPAKRQYGSLRYDKRTCSLNLLKGTGVLTWMAKGRFHFNFQLPTYYQQFINWKIMATQLVYKDKAFWLHVALGLPTPAKQVGVVMGIDKGITNFIFCSDGTSERGEDLKNKRKYYQKRRKELQSKGTRSAKRKLRTLSGREKRFVTDKIYCIVKKLLHKPVSIYAVEDLTRISVQKRLKIKGKTFNRLMSNWVYRKFDHILSYKAEMYGKTVVFIDPRYTSQKCSQVECGYIYVGNRKGEEFVCLRCGFATHADYNASINISAAAVNQPNVSLPAHKATDVEVLSKSTLSSVASLRSCTGGI